MNLKRISRRGVLRLTALGGLAGSAPTALTVSRAAATDGTTFHPAVGVWEHLAQRLDVAGESFYNQFALLVGGVALFNSPPIDVEPNDDQQYSGPFFGVWEADGPTAIAFSVRHGLYNANVLVTGFEDWWGTAVLSPDGSTLEVSHTFSETDASGGEKYSHSRTATFTRHTLRRSASRGTSNIPTAQ